MQAFKSALASVGERVGKITGWIYGKYDNNRKKCKGVLITLAVLSFLTGLIVGSFKSVDSLNQGVPINHTSGTIIDAVVTNSGSFLGLNSYYYTLPATNFLLTFNTAQQSTDSANIFPSISARTVQGIKVQLQVYAKVKVVAANLKSFLQEYGMGLVDGMHTGWQIYIKEKIRNVVGQSVAGYKFYQITNQALSAKINADFTSFITSHLNYPFLVSIVGINVRYPTNTIEVNDTLGIRLLKQSSKLSQLDTQLALLNQYLKQYTSQIKNYVLKQATNDGMMASREESIKLDNKMWGEGLQLLNATLQNSTLVQKYLEVYFNSLYNVTYRASDLKPFII